MLSDVEREMQFMFCVHMSVNFVSARTKLNVIDFAMKIHQERITVFGWRRWLTLLLNIFHTDKRQISSNSITNANLLFANWWKVFVKQIPFIESSVAETNLIVFNNYCISIWAKMSNVNVRTNERKATWNRESFDKTKTKLKIRFFNVVIGAIGIQWKEDRVNESVRQRKISKQNERKEKRKEFWHEKKKRSIFSLIVCVTSFVADNCCSLSRFQTFLNES